MILKKGKNNAIHFCKNCNKKIRDPAICGAAVAPDYSLTPLNLNVSFVIMHTNSIRVPADTELRDSI